MANLTTYQEKLPNAPLKEVIFEVHWDLDVKENGQRYDKGFQYAVGVFRQKAHQNGFSFDKETVPDPRITLINQPSHQFWTAENTYPVLQIGQGVMALNHTENYHWDEGYKRLINGALNILTESYETKIKFNQVMLRYVNAVDLSPEESKNIRSFIYDNFQTSISRNFEIEGELDDISLSESYKLKDNSKLSLIFSTGRNQVLNIPAFVWQNIVSKNAKMGSDDILSWAEMAHTTTSKLFVTMLKQEFYDSFK